MTRDEAARRLAALLREENSLLTAGNTTTAVQLLGEKHAAIEAFQSASPAVGIEPGLAKELRALTLQNRTLLAQAIEVQGRVLAMVARAARAARPGVVRYGAGGQARTDKGAVALGLRA